MRKVFAQKAPDVANHLQYVLIDGEHMKEIMLHLADDFAKGRNVTAKDAELIH